MVGYKKMINVDSELNIPVIAEGELTILVESTAALTSSNIPADMDATSNAAIKKMMQ